MIHQQDTAVSDIAPVTFLRRIVDELHDRWPLAVEAVADAVGVRLAALGIPMRGGSRDDDLDSAAVAATTPSPDDLCPACQEHTTEVRVGRRDGPPDHMCLTCGASAFVNGDALSIILIRPVGT